MLTWIILIIVGYLFGSIPVSYLVGKRRGVDLRKRGTRQVGGGNLWRMTSRRWGLLVGFFDFIKGILLIGVSQHQGLDAGQQLAQLDELAAVAGREDQWSHDTALRCATASCLMPAIARSSIASSCGRSNVACSAVPWTSISLPASSPTTFMSTSALLSST